MKRKWNRVLASLLCALMISSDVSGLIPVASAAPTPAAATVTDTGVKDNFRDPSNGRPNLFVSFLGDNNNYIYTQGGANSGLTRRNPASLNTISTPAPYDQSSDINPTGPGNTWHQYLRSPDCADANLNSTIFWVGVGVDRMQLWKLLESGQGLTSLEAGFYYDSAIIEPYVDSTLSADPAEAYRLTIQKANINNPNYPANTQWGDNYTVVRAITDLEPPETDPVTREELDTPTIYDIMNNATATTTSGQSQWKMTYVSLELTDVESTAKPRRLAGVYTGPDALDKGVDDQGDEVPVVPDGAAGDQYVVDGDPSSGYDCQYLLLIPFRLKNYGTPEWTPLRLVRDATHFSIGGSAWGVDAYGAWERTTTRNPEVTAVAGDGISALGVEGHPARDLKLLTRFAGDLNLFAPGRTAELEYDALLRIIGDGGSLNHAQLSVKGDPAVWPVWADTNGDIIGGLQSGQGMHLDVHTQDNYVATVTVTYVQDDGAGGAETIYHQYTQTYAGDHDNSYEFVMPAFVPVGARRVTVTVTFAYKAGDNALVYLTELPQPGEAGHAVGNEATLRTSLTSTYDPTADTEIINSYSSTVAHPNYSHPGLTHPNTPVANAKKDGYVDVTIQTHADYVAIVQIYDFRAQGYMTSGLTIDATGAPGVVPNTTMIPNPDYGSVAGATATIPGPDYGKITLPQGGTIRLRMGSQDLDVIIRYEKGQQVQATLEVYNTDPNATNFDLNTAQLVYDQYDALNLATKAYSAVTYHDYDGTVSPANPNDHRAIHPTRGGDKLPWVSTSQASVSGSLGGDTGRAGKTWNPKDLPTPEDEVVGGKTVMALLAGSAQKSDFQAGVNGMDFATALVDDGSASGLVGLRKSAGGEVYGDPDISAALDVDVDDPTVIDVLWEIRQAIDADTATGGLRDTYLKTVTKSDSSVAYTYYDLTPAQLQAYLLEVFQAHQAKAANDLAYRIANRRYLTVLAAYNQVKDIPAYAGMSELKPPAKNLNTTVTNGTREFQDRDYTDTYLAQYDAYLDEYEDYLDALNLNAGTGGSGAPTAPTSYPGALAPARKTISLKTNSAAVAALGAYTWTPAAVPTQVPAGQQGNTIETRAGRTVYIVMEADSAYELDTANIDVFQRGSAPGYATGARITTPSTVTPVAVPGYKNVYSFTMPNQDCVVRVTYKLRGTRTLNITYRGAAGLDDNEAVVEAYSVATPPATTPQLNTVTNKGYTTGALPSGGSYDAFNDVYTPDPIEAVFRGSVVTIRAKAAEGYEVKSVEAKNSDDTVISVTKRPADDPKDGDIYTFTIAEDRADDVNLVITYGPEVDEEYTATIHGSTEGAVDGNNKATWYVVNGSVITTPTVISSVRPGTHLIGHVSVAPGYYIKSVTAWGASGNYTYTVTGNGYNNGFGTTLTGTDVPIEIYVDMPHEDLIVDVVFAKGPPPPAPGNTLTLIVKDDDNTETDLTKAAPNWAKAEVYDVKPANRAATASELDLPTVGALPGNVVGKNALKGNGTLTDRKYVEAGKWVVVDFSAYVVMKPDTSEGAAPGATVVDTDRSYYVSSVTVGPDNLGIALVWEGSTSVSFYMPAGSTAITVEFSKYPSSGRLPDYVLTVRETYTDLNPGAATPPTTNEYSFITSARSETIGRWSQIMTSPGVSVPGRSLDWRTNPERVPPLNDPSLSDAATGAATAGEQVTMTFDVDEGDGTAANPGWYYQSVVLISNGAATRLTDNVTKVSSATRTIGGKLTTITTYQVQFHMPTSAAEFVVHYRKGPKPTVPDYAFTLTIDDPHNVYDPAALKWDENSVRADFQDPTGAAGSHDSLEVGRNKDSMTAVQHIHAGDIITLTTALDTGYYLEYMIVNPAGLKIYPVWTDPDTATFVMPTEGVAVVAKVIKGDPQRYTANLILRYEDENGNEILPPGKSIHDIGWGTFVLPDPASPGDTIGSLDDYAKKAIYSTVQTPGTTIPYDLYAFDGYYIDRITVEPVILGVTGSLSGSCGHQDGDFVMPHASVNVNVWFKSGWPDEIPYDLTIKVHDSSLEPLAPGQTSYTPEDHNYAALRAISGRVPAPSVLLADRMPVFGGQTKVIDRDNYPLDRDVVLVDVKAQPGFHVSSSTIKVTDSLGNPVAWWYVPGGIAFVQPPRAVTVDVTFRQGEPNDKYTATLHLSGYRTGDASVDKDIVNDYVLLSARADNLRAKTTAQAAGVTAPPVAVDTDTAVISNLYHGDTLDLSALPGAGRHISAAYAVTTDGELLPIYNYDASGSLTAAQAHYVPGKPGTPTDNSTTPATPAVPGTVTHGAFAMPESNVDVYVKFASGAISATDMPVNLEVSGPAGSGDANAVIHESVGADQTMSVSAPGMDSRYTAQGNETVVTFEPAPGYGITRLEVTNNTTGANVPYDWISVLQDPAVIDSSTQDNSNLWPGVAPAPGVTHPTYKPNPEKQIKLTVPSGGVTIHVTYGAISTQPFKAQVVVNDPLAGTSTTSRNNAWLSQKAGADADDPIQKKLQYAVPGEWVDLDITVHPGYRIEYVKVIPQSFGIVPGLPIGTDMGGGITYYLHDQQTGFFMPDGDCTVYVKFVADGIATKNATLVVNGAPVGNTANRATITSPSSGTKGPVYVNGTPQSVSARPAVDWITVDYDWDTATSSVASISVTVAGTTTNVPFSQVLDPATGHGQLTFPMNQDDVIVTITYQADPTPVGQEVVLHVIDRDKDATRPILLDNENYGRLKYDGNSAINAGPDDTGKVGFTAAMAAAGTFETTATIHVPAGQTVDVTACSDALGLDGNGTVYIQSAYVLFEQNAQMIHFNLTPDSLLGGAGPGYTGLHDESSFVVHPGRNDVYVTLTRKAPVEDEHAAVLMIRSPSADTRSEAGIHADQSAASWNDADPALRDKVRANDPNDSHAYVVAKDGDKITVSVEPASGYVIDYVQVTPLGFPLDTDPVYHFNRVGNTITFDMPHVNVAITVYLKRGSETNFTATLHFIQDPNCPAGNTPQLEDYAKLSWTPTGQHTESIWADAKPAGAGTPAGSNQEWTDTSRMIIKEGSTVTLDVTLDTNPATGQSDVILAAFVVWKDRGSIVSLAPVYPAGRTLMEGLEGVTESASGLPDNDNTIPDATGTFKMPMGDVEVYVVVTTVPPTDPWHTVALVATDHSPTGNNSGLNQGDLWNKATPADKRVAISDKIPTVAWITVTETDTFSVLPRAGAGYRFDDPAVMTGNDGTTRNLSTPYANFLYEVSSILCNQVVRIDFESSDALTLTVEIEDPDNPGNGTVEQVVTADPPGTTPPTLRLTSDSVAGSYQIISGITAGGTVQLTAKPYKDDKQEYSVYATLYYFDGTSEDVPLTDADGDGVWEGSFTMPSNNARVVFTFYDGYEGALTLVNRIAGDATGQATMKEDKRGLPPLMVHSMNNSDKFHSLPNGTGLDAQVTSDMTGRTVTGLLTRNGVTTILPATPSDTVGDPDHFYHTIDRSDAEITLVLDSPTEHPDSYIAAVDWVNKPAATDHPVIEDKTTAGQLRGADRTWTTAVKDDSVEVTLNVPYGYEATISAVTVPATAGGLAVAVPLTYTAPLDGPAAPGADKVHTATFTMPKANVQVTVTYRKVLFDLKLRVIDLSGVAGNATAVTPTAGDVVGALTSLTADGQSTTLRSGGAVSVTATPDNTAVAPAEDPHIVAVYYQTSGGATAYLEPAALAAGAASAKSFTMPSADTTVTVIYDRTDTSDPDDKLYIATVEVVGDDGDPGNRAVSLVNLSDGTLPASSPDWAAGYAGNAMKVSYEAATGYYVTVTARRADTGASIPVLQLGSATNGTGSVTMPAANIIITLTYSKDKPDQTNNVALQLLGHRADGGNKASATNFTDPTQLAGLATDGTTPNHAPHVPEFIHATDPVETVSSAAALGDDLRTLANWANGSQVIRMTVAVRKVTRDALGVVTAVDETPEVGLLVSKYADTATSRAPAPITTGPDEEIVIRVYYGDIYSATLHLVGDDPTDGHTATDTVTYTNAYNASDASITKPISHDLDRMEGYQGDGTEDVRTTVSAGPGRRVVDVVWESDLTGAASATPYGTPGANGDGRYDFTMPEADVDFYAFFEPDDPDTPKHYVAKVAFDPASQHLGDPANAVSIKNLTNTTAAGGKYWVEAQDGENITVTVKVAAGYQARIVSTKIDDPAQLGLLPDLFDGATTRKPTAADDYQYYISRTQFVYNLPGGKEASFTMPKDTDATVTVKFTKGYDLTLDVTDRSLLDGKTEVGTNQVTTTYNAGDTLRWTHNGTVDPTTQSYTPDPAILRDREGGKKVSTLVTAYDDAKVKRKVTRYTPFTGTATLSNLPPLILDYSFTMPYEDTQVSVLLQDEDAPDDLLAKVELLGDSDVTGNRATPVIDHTDPTNTTTGAVWTTTSEGNTIDLTLTVARGYVAKIKVRRDDSVDPADPTDESKWVYLDAQDYQFKRVWDDKTLGPNQSKDMAIAGGVTQVEVGYNADALPQQTFPDSVGGVQHFRFIMPTDLPDPTDLSGTTYLDTKTDVTILVEFVRSSDIPRPFDPRNDDLHDRHPAFLDEGFIYGENRGDFAIVEIPTLAMEEDGAGTQLYDTDNYDAPPATVGAVKDVAKAVKRFNFYLRTVSDTGVVSYERLDPGEDIVLVPWREEELLNATDPYNYYVGEKEGMWTGTELWKDTDPAAQERDFVGSKFKLYPAEPDPKTGKRTAEAQALYDMLNNAGSLERYTVSDPANPGQTVTKYRTRLVVQAEDPTSVSDYTEVWIRPWYALGVKVSSYGPTHPVTGKLYKLMTEHELNVANGYWDEDENVLATTTLTAPETPDPDNLQHYKWDEKAQPTVEDAVVLEGEGSGKWLQILRMRSSELLGGFTSAYDPTERGSDPAQPGDRTLLDNPIPGGEVLTYALQIEKTSNLTYTRVKLDLDPNSPDYAAPNAPLSAYYEETGGKPDYATRTFMLQDTIQLIAGDVDQNGQTKVQDYDAVYDFVYRARKWTDLDTEPTEPAVGAGAAAWSQYNDALAVWALSVYNPDSAAYRCDLDGDRKLTVVDLNIVNTRFNYNRDEDDYRWYFTDGGQIRDTLPFGMGPRDSGQYDALFALRVLSEGEIFTDDYWDGAVDPAQTLAVPMETYYVDADGNFTLSAEPPRQPDPTPPAPDDEEEDDHDERVETPLGEEVLDRRPWTELPQFWEDEPSPEEDPEPEGEDPEETVQPAPEPDGPEIN